MQGSVFGVNIITFFLAHTDAGNNSNVKCHFPEQGSGIFVLIVKK